MIMSNLSLPNKAFLEEVFNMRGGYVLDFSNASFSNYFAELNIDIYDDEKYPGFGDSKANRMRAFWKNGSNQDVSLSISLLADYIEAKKASTDGWGGETFSNITELHLTKMREISQSLASTLSVDSAEITVTTSPVTITTEATVTDNRIQIEIHDDIYNHIKQYLINQDHFHAVEESYKLVREKLRDITGKEKAHEAFSESNYEKIFGHQPTSDVEKDFFEGVKFLNMSIQFLRNEKAHTPATPLEHNLAIHYIALASLAYDLITRYVSDETVQSIENAIIAKKHEYKSATAFYDAFENGGWLQDLVLPVGLTASLRRALKNKWYTETDFTTSYDSSNLALMRLELISAELTVSDIDSLLDLPTKDKYGNDQLAGMLQFMEFIQQIQPNKISKKVTDWILEHKQD